jgi:hypothetical protein
MSRPASFSSPESMNQDVECRALTPYLICVESTYFCKISIPFFYKIIKEKQSCQKVTFLMP